MNYLRQSTENHYSKRMKTNLLKILNLVEMNGQVIYSMNEQKANPDYDWMVALPSTHHIVHDLFDEILQEYLRDKAKELAGSDRWLGISKMGGGRSDYELVVYDHIKPALFAIETGILRGLSSILDCTTGEDIILPSPQTHGTDQQQQMYAHLKALEIMPEYEPVD